MNERNQSCGGTSTKCRKAPGQSRAILTRLELPSGVGRVAVKVRYPSRVRCAYLSKPLKVRTAYPTWYGFHLRGCKPICMNVGRRTGKERLLLLAFRSFLMRFVHTWLRLIRLGLARLVYILLAGCGVRGQHRLTEGQQVRRLPKADRAMPKTRIQQYWQS